MSTRPATLVPEEAIPILEEKAIIQATFEQLTGTGKPWEINLRKFNELRDKLHRVESELRATNPGKEITCIIGEKGMYWLFEEAFNAYKEKIEDAVKAVKEEGPMPVWRYTTAELLESHVNNMRQLIMAVAHDEVMLTMLKESLGDNHVMINREFENCERNVRAMLDDIRDQGEFLLSTMSHDILMAERCRITRDMIEKGAIQESDLGYTANDLREVEKVIDERCKKALPAYQKRIASMYSIMQEEMRKSESTQLARASRWVLAYSLMEPPEGFKGQAEIANKEHESLATVVASREEELGESEEGKKALKVSEEAAQTKTPPVEEIPEPEPVEEEPPAKKKKVARMATISRRR